VNCLKSQAIGGLLPGRIAFAAGNEVVGRLAKACAQWCASLICRRLWAPIFFLLISVLHAGDALAGFPPPVTGYVGWGSPSPLYATPKEACESTQDPGLRLPVIGVRLDFGTTYICTFSGPNFGTMATSLSGTCPPNSFGYFGLCYCNGGFVERGNSCYSYGAPDPGKNGGCPDCPQGNPINSGTGNKFQNETDYTSGGTYPFNFGRVYNSQSQATTGISAYGWRAAITRLITPLSATTALAVRPGQKEFFFSKVNGVWVGDSDVNDKLREEVNASGVRTGWTYFSDKDELERYDANGRLLSIQNRQGFLITLTYPAAGGVEYTDSFGRKILLINDALGFLSQMKDPAGQMYLYERDSLGRLASVTYPGGKKRQYLYESILVPGQFVYRGYLVGIIDENGDRYATWKYDTQGRAISSEHGAGADKVTLSYGASATTVTDAVGSTRNFGMVTQVGVVRSTGNSQPAGSGSGAASSSIQRDGNGNPGIVKDFNNSETRIAYDTTRNLETRRVEAVGTAQQRVTHNTQWHSVWRLPVKKSEPNRITSFVYNGDTVDGAVVTCAPATATMQIGGVTQPIGVLCRKTIQPTNDPVGAIGFSAPAAGTPRTWTYTYNNVGQVLTATGPRTDVVDKTTYTYDAQGNLTTVTNAAGHVTTLSNYDAHGRAGRIVDPNGMTTDLVYHARGWLLSKTVSGAGGGSETTSYEYDGVGQLKKVTNPDGAAVFYDYDAAHRLKGMSDSLGNSIVYTLDAMGNRTREEVKDPGGALVRQTTRVFDALNRLKEVTGGTQ
jgi:YD repeat-containing protein